MKEEFKKQTQAMQRAAQEMKSVLISPQFGVGGYISDAGQRDDAIAAAAGSSDLFSSMGNVGNDIAIIGASAIRQYEAETGHLPSDEILAAAHNQMETIFSSTQASELANNGAYLLSSLNSANMETSQGVDVRATTAAIILPTLLANPLNDAINYLPAVRKSEMEVFYVENVAGSDFGGLKKGDIIDSMTSGRFTQTRQRYDTPQQPDGTRTSFAFDSAADGMAKKTPFKKGVVRVYIDRLLVATDIQKDGKLYGSVKVGQSDVPITGTVDYDLGKATITITPALPAGMSVALGFDVDIEANAALIPKVSQAMGSFKVQPSERVIAASETVQSMFLASIEHGINLRSLNLSAMRNLLADEKARNQLHDIYWHTTKTATFNANVSGATDWRIEYEKLRAKLEGLSTDLLRLTNESGMVGMYCGKNWATLFKSLPESMFKFASGYNPNNTIQFVGTLFGRYKIFEVPQEGIVPANEFIGYAKSNNIGRCGYITGDVVAPTLYSTEIDKTLNKGDTLYAYGYDDVHPRSGGDFFVKVTLQNYTMAS